LRARVDEPAKRRALVAFAEDETLNVVKQAGVAQALESLARMLSLYLVGHDAIEQLEQDELLAGADHIGAVLLAVHSEAEKVPRLVDGLGATGENERPFLAQLVRVGNELVGVGAVNLHARYEEHLWNLALETGLAGTDVSVPLAQDYARF